MAPRRQEQVAQAIAGYIVSEANEDVEIRLDNLSADSPTNSLLQDSLAGEGLLVETDTIETCPAIVLPPEWNAYLATLRGKDRHELRRKIRRAENAADLTYSVTGSPEQLDDDLATFISLHRMSQQDDKQGFMTPAKAAFFGDMAHRLWREGMAGAGLSVCRRPTRRRAVLHDLRHHLRRLQLRIPSRLRFPERGNRAVRRPHPQRHSSRLHGL